MPKENCFYYFEEQDMGAHIPCCRLTTGVGDCPCDHCGDYISKRAAYKLVREKQHEITCSECAHYHKGFNCDLLQKPFDKDPNIWYCADRER